MALTARWAKSVLDYDPFGGDQGDPGDYTLRDVIVESCRKAGTCHDCGQGFAQGMTIRKIEVRDPDRIRTYKWCRACCDAMALSWTDGGDAISARHRLRMARGRQGQAPGPGADGA